MARSRGDRGDRGGAYDRGGGGGRDWSGGGYDGGGGYGGYDGGKGGKGWGKGGGKWGGDQGAGGGSTDNRAIQITGEVRSRLSLKNEMERFGRVEICYMGDRHQASAAGPWVRFALASSAEAALTAINA